ncbi:DUF4214 domain-containing protein [Massilia sp. YIM B04103]|uniref:DUF4214 domain-containing protein n=1 Tax=Massilia sp. YIM B04103 TaxID=2963106 RepID=UPI00210E592E|nr:DUF4214 domain-containing protein [Massilia sp. YIM B04103]
MVAMVSGNGLGILNSSASVLGQQGLFGNAAHGQTKEAAYVNLANGNLVLQDQDEWLAARGVNLALTRTYNSQGNFNDGNGLNWKNGSVKQVTGLSGTLNGAGSTVSRIDGDGSVQLYTYDAGLKLYRSSDGAGGYQTLSATAALEWTWRSDRRDLLGVHEVYDGSKNDGRITAVRDQLGLRIGYQYNADGQLAVLSNGSGDKTYYDYANGKLAQIRSDLGGGASLVRTRYAYDELGRLSSVSVDLTPEDGSIGDGNAYVSRYEYEGESQRISVLQQADGTSIRFRYTAEGKVRSISDALGRSTTLEYDEAGRTTVVSDALGRKTSYRYDARGQLTGVSGPLADNLNPETQFSYDASGNLLRAVAANGLAIDYGYDANGNRILERDGAGNTVSRVYDLSSNQLLNETVYAVADPDGAGPAQAGAPQTRRLVYDASNRLRFRISAEGRVSELRYNALGELASELSYTAQLYATAALAPAATLTEAALNAWVASAAVDKSRVSRTDYLYDGRGQLSSVLRFANTNAAGVGLLDGQQSETVYVYGPSGQLLKSIDGNKNATAFTYDGLGRQLSKTDAQGNAALSTYGQHGELVLSSSANGATTTFIRDKAGQLIRIQQQQAEEQGTVQHLYRADGQRYLSIGATGQRTYWLYDALGRKTAQIEHYGALTEFSYDAAGLLLQTTQYATAVDTAVLLDGAGQPSGVTLAALRPAASADDRRSWNSYDKAGRLSATVDANGYLSRMSYDGASRLVQTVRRAKPLEAAQLVGGQIPAPSADEASAADSLTRTLYDRDGKLVGQLDANGYLTEHRYNAGGQLLETVAYFVQTAAAARSSSDINALRPAAHAADLRQRFIYDGRNQLVGSIDADNYLTETTYDQAGNVASRRRYAVAVSTPAAPTLASVGKVLHAADRLSSYTYTSLNQLLRESTAGGLFTDYQYDAAGNVVTVTRGMTAAAERASSKRYDALGRLTAQLTEEGTAELAKLGSDPAPAAVAALWARFAEHYAYDAAGRRSSVSDVRGNRTLSYYDRQGRLTHTINALGEVTEQRYDSLGQLAHSVQYGRRIEAATLAALQGGQPDALLERTLAALAGNDRHAAFYYDAAGRLAYSVNGAGEVQGMRYDGNGKLVQSIRYRGRLAEAARAALVGGALSRAASELAPVLQQTADWQRNLYYYDVNGRLIFSVNAAGEVEGRGYDQFGQLNTLTRYAARREIASLSGNAAEAASLALNDAANAVESYAYNRRGQLIDSADANKNHVLSEFNAFGELAKRTQLASAGSSALAPAADVSSQTLYDANGRVLATVDGVGAVTSFSYDSAGNITERIALATPVAVTAKADDIRAALANGSLSVPERDQRQRFAYDANGRLALSMVLNAVENQTVAGNKLAYASIWSVMAWTYEENGGLAERHSTQALMRADDLAPQSAKAADWLAGVLTSGDASVRTVYDATGRVAATATMLRAEAGVPLWSVVSHSYDGKGNLLQRRAHATELRGAKPTAAQILALAASADDSVICNEYDGQGRLTASAQALGAENGIQRWAVSVQDYDAAGNVLRRIQYATALAGNELPADFSRLVRADGAADRATRYAYDAANRLVATVDAQGGASRLVYDARGNVLQTIALADPVDPAAPIPAVFAGESDKANRVTRTVYDLANRPLYVIDALGNVSEKRYDALGNVVALQRYASAIDLAKLTAQPAAREVAALLAANGGHERDRTERYVYDQNRRLRFTVDALGYVKETQYNALGQVSKTLEYPVAARPVTDANAAAIIPLEANAQLAKARVTSHGYDNQGNLISTTDALGKTESYTYDAQGRKIGFTNKLKQRWTYGYDAGGRLAMELKPAVIAYDSNGLSATQTQLGVAMELQLQTLMDYDAFGNLIRRHEGIPGETGRVTEYRYDTLGRQVQTRRTAQRIYAVDADVAAGLNGAVYEKDSGPLWTEVRYDALGNAVANRDVGGRMSYKLYDRLGQVRYEVDAAGYVTGYERDAFGGVTVLTRYGVEAQLEGRRPDQLALADFARTLRPSYNSDRCLYTKYDLLGRVARLNEAIVTVYDRNATGGTPYVAAGKTTVFEYTAFGEERRRSSYGSNPLGYRVTEEAVTRSYYNVRGEKVAEIAALAEAPGPGASSGYLTTYVYDDAGNLKTKVEYANAATGWDDYAYTRGADAVFVDRTWEYGYDAGQRRTSETRVNVRYADGAGNAVSGHLVTSYVYDDLGNQIAVIDPLKGSTYTYYDTLGRTIAVARKPASDGKEAVPPQAQLTEFKLDLFGNTVLRVDYANGPQVGKIGADGYHLPDGAWNDVNNRVTATRFDLEGRALEVMDAVQFMGKRQSTRLSYDEYGRVAKQWQTVTDHTERQYGVYEIRRYDALGHVIESWAPANRDLVDAPGAAAAVTRKTQKYNAFGEVTGTGVVYGNGPEQMVSYTDYDVAGRAWRSNGGDGVDKVTLYDVQGRATAMIRSAGRQEEQTLRRLEYVEQALQLENVLREEIRYNLLGQVVDRRELGEGRLAVLVRRDRAWVRDTLARGQALDENTLLLLGDASDAGKVVSLRYRLAGASAWTEAGAPRLQWIDGLPVFSTRGLPPGEYEYKVMLQSNGLPAYERESGKLKVVSDANADAVRDVVQLYLMLFDRAPDLAGLNLWLGEIAKGASRAELIQGMLAAPEAVTRFLRLSGEDAIKLIYRSAFNVGEADLAARAGEIADWGQRYAKAAAERPDGRGLVLSDLLYAVLAYRGPGGQLLEARALALRNYLVNGGSDPAVARELMVLAQTRPADALQEGAARGALERARTQVIRMYLTVFGRAPERRGIDFWLPHVQNGLTLEAMAEGFLDSEEAQLAWLYPSTGLTPEQYKQQLVTRVYGMMLSRAPSAAELATWMGKLTGANPISRGQFIVQLSEQVIRYDGPVAAQVAERNLFNNRVALALTAGVAVGHELDIDGGSALLAGVTSDANAKDAAAKAQAALKAVAETARLAAIAAGVAAGATPLEEMRRTIARLYLMVLNRVADKSGLEFYLKSNPTTSQAWLQMTQGFLDSAEAKGLLPDWKGMSHREFVARLYANALGAIPASKAVQAELNAFVAQLEQGANRVEVTLAIVRGMLGASDLPLADQGYKSLLDNRSAVCLTVAEALDLDSAEAQKTTLNLVTASDIKAALSYAYDYNAKSLRARLEAARAQASIGLTLSEAMLAAGQAGAAAISAATALAANPAAAQRLQLIQLYTVLLNRTLDNPPDIAGLEFHLTGPGKAAIEVQAQNVLASPEGLLIFAPGLSDRAFVEKLYMQMLGTLSVLPADTVDYWTAQLGATPAPTRGKIACDIVNAMLAYSTGRPSGSELALLNARAVFTQRVADIYLKVEQSTSDEVARLSAQQAEMKRLVDELKARLAPLEQAKNASEAAKNAALGAVANAQPAVNAAGDGKGAARLQILRLYATLLQRSPAHDPPHCVEIDFWINISPEQAAYSIMGSTEGSKLLSPGLGNEDFVRQLYALILGRQPKDAAEIKIHLDYLAKNASAPYVRGALAVSILNAYSNYSDGEPAQLQNKKLFDQNIVTMLTRLDRQAKEEAAAASAKLASMNALAAAVAAAQKDKMAKDAAATAATPAATTARTVLQSAYRREIVELHQALRGPIDYASLLNLVTRMQSGAVTIASLTKDWIASFPADNAGFVKKLYNTVLSREPSNEEIQHHAGQMPPRTRYDTALVFLNSPEGRNTYPAKADPVEAGLLARANSDLAAKDKADREAQEAAAAVRAAQDNVAASGSTPAAAAAEESKSKQAAAAYAALLAMYPKVLDADDKVLAATEARLRYEPVQAQWSKAQADYSQFPSAKLSAYQAALGVGALLKSALNTRAAAAAQQAAAGQVYQANTTGFNALRITHLFSALLNHVPALGELQYWLDKMAGGQSLAQVAEGLMNSTEAKTKNLYPATMSNDVFVAQVYNYAFGRGFNGDPTSQRFWSSKITGSVTRADIAVAITEGGNNNFSNDTRVLNEKAMGGLRPLANAVISDAELNAAIAQANQQEKALALAYDATAMAAFNASPDAQRMTQVVRLYLAALGRAPEAAGLRFWYNHLRNGMTPVVAAQNMLDSAEGVRLYPAGQSGADFLRQLFISALGREPNPAEASKYGSQLASLKRGQVVVNVINDVLTSNDNDLLSYTSRTLFIDRTSMALAAARLDTAKYEKSVAKAVEVMDSTVKAGVANQYTIPMVQVAGTAASGSRVATGNNQLTLDRWGNVLAVADARDQNFKISYTYNHDNQRLTQTVNALLRDANTAPRVQFRYDALGRLVATQDANNNLNRYEYDARGNATKEIHADGGIVSSAYDLFGNRLYLKRWNTDTTGVQTNYAYDQLGRMLKSWSEAEVEVHAVNVDDNNEFVMTPAFLERMNPLRKQLVDSFAYDELGRRIRSTNGIGVNSYTEYDADGNVIATMTEDRYRVVTSYDAFHNRLRSRNAEDKEMTWVTDSFGRISSQTDMGGGVSTFQYDGAGRRTLMKVSRDGKDGEVRYSYNNGQLWQVQDSASGLATTYLYDAAGNRLFERQNYMPGAQVVPQRVQNNALSYDMQNRLVGIRDNLYELKYTYDNNGNRLTITTKYGNEAAFTVYNAYDKMNRQTVANGDLVAGRVVYGEQGHELSYDKAGNRLTDTFKGVAIGVDLRTTPNQKTVETYTYDGMGRLSTVSRDNRLIDLRWYDAASRITQSGMIFKPSDPERYATTQAGVLSQHRIYAYDIGNHVIHQKEHNWDTPDVDTYFVSDKDNRNAGYDKMGNLKGYTVVVEKWRWEDYGRYVIDHKWFEGAKEARITQLKDRTASISDYDVYGNRLSVTDQTGKVKNQLFYDVDGHVQSRIVDGEADFNLIVNGQVLGEENQKRDNILGATYIKATASALSAPPSLYTVMSTSETLQSIAQGLWGDGNLWYLIADANNLASDAKLKVGQALTIPTRANTVHNDYTTFKPYDEGAQIGDTMPAMPTPSRKGGCSGGNILIAVVAVVATIFTAGAMAGLLSIATGATSTFGAGLAMLGGAGGFTAGALATGAVAAAAGSVAGQLTAMGLGYQDEFSWRSVATAAVGGVVSAGVAGADLGGLSSVFKPSEGIYTAAAARAVLSNTVTQGLSMATGLQHGFDWRGVAASAAGALASQAVGQYLQGDSVIAKLVKGNELATRTLGDFASGTAAAIARGGKIDVVRIATDAFGNALGSSLADIMQRTPATPVKSFSDSIDRGPDWYQDWKARRQDMSIAEIPGIDFSSEAESVGSPQEQKKTRTQAEIDYANDWVDQKKGKWHIDDKFQGTEAVKRGLVNVLRDGNTLSLNVNVLVGSGDPALARDYAKASQDFWGGKSFTDTDGTVYRTNVRVGVAEDRSKATIWLDKSLPAGSDVTTNWRNSEQNFPISALYGKPSLVYPHEFAHVALGVWDAYGNVTFPDGAAMKGVPRVGFEDSIMANTINGKLRFSDLKGIMLHLEKSQYATRQGK